MSRRSDELDRQAQALDDAPAWSADEAEVIDLEEQDIAARRKAIHDDLKTWAPEAMAHAGAIVTVNREGDAEMIRGLVREVDRKALASAQKVVSRSTGVAADHVPDGSQPGAIVTERRTPDCSESLAKRLAAHRTVALQVMLSRNTPVALASLAHVLVQRAFGYEYRRAGSALQITTQLPAHTLLSVADDLKECAAWQAVEAAKLTWKARLPGQSGTWFAWLIALPQAELLDLLALCAALTLNALPSTGAASDSNALAEAVGLDMADWWEPTAQGYLNHVPKAQIVQALKEVGPDLAEDGVGAMKKDVLVDKAASRLAGKRWLPAMLRHRSAPER